MKIMRMRKVASLGEVINSKNFANVHKNTSKLARLEAILGLYLDQQLRSLCRISSFREGNLTLATTQATAASQLRYLSRIYTQQLRQHEEFRELKHIRVIAVAPAASSYRRPAKPLPLLSADTIGLLQETAALLADPEISGALERLARHGGDQPAAPSVEDKKDKSLI